jgi:hypothetical protein
MNGTTARPMSIGAELFRSGDPILISCLSIKIVSTAYTAALKALEKLSIVIKTQSTLRKAYSANARWPIVAVTGLALDVHNLSSFTRHDITIFIR